MDFVNLNTGSTMPLVGCKYCAYCSYWGITPSDKWLISFIKPRAFVIGSVYILIVFIVGTFKVRGHQLISKVIDAALNAGYRAIGKYNLCCYLFFWL